MRLPGDPNSIDPDSDPGLAFAASAPVVTGFAEHSNASAASFAVSSDPVPWTSDSASDSFASCIASYSYSASASCSIDPDPNPWTSDSASDPGNSFAPSLSVLTAQTLLDSWLESLKWRDGAIKRDAFDAATRNS